MKFAHAIRKIFFKSIDAELAYLYMNQAYQEKCIELFMKNFKLTERELELQSKILLNYTETFQELKNEQGLTIPFPEKTVVKYNV